MIYTIKLKSIEIDKEGSLVRFTVFGNNGLVETFTMRIDEEMQIDFDRNKFYPLVYKEDK